eukprot:660136-Amorphochlora_amoeboformis.AAC.1
MRRTQAHMKQPNLPTKIKLLTSNNPPSESYRRHEKGNPSGFQTHKRRRRGCLSPEGCERGCREAEDGQVPRLNHEAEKHRQTCLRRGTFPENLRAGDLGWLR